MQIQTTTTKDSTALIRELREIEKLAYERDKNSPIGFMLTRQRNRLLRSLMKGRGSPITAARLVQGSRN